MGGDHPPFYPPFLLRVPHARGCVFAPACVRVAPALCVGAWMIGRKNSLTPLRGLLVGQPSSLRLFLQSFDEHQSVISYSKKVRGVIDLVHVLQSFLHVSYKFRVVRIL